MFLFFIYNIFFDSNWFCHPLLKKNLRQNQISNTHLRKSHVPIPEIQVFSVVPLRKNRPGPFRVPSSTQGLHLGENM